MEKIITKENQKHQERIEMQTDKIIKNTEFQFHFKNLLANINIIVQTQDNIGNIYFATFDNLNIGIPGVKIHKYDINTTKTSIIWDNPKWQTGISSIIINNDNIYVGSVNGGAYILNNNVVKQIPTVSGSVRTMYINKNNLYIIATEGLYLYNIITDDTKIISLPNNTLPFQMFIDSKENIYFSLYNHEKKFIYLMKKNGTEFELITGDVFFNNNVIQQFIEINQKIYFYSVDYINKESHLYSSNLGKNNVDFLFKFNNIEIRVFNINNNVALITQVNDDTILKVLINNNFEQKYEIKNKVYNYKYTVVNTKNLYLLDINGKKIDNLNWN